MKCSFWLTALLLGGTMLHAAVVDVTKFGAKNDGTGDNAAAFDAAVRELKAQNGGELYFPAGKYRITTRRNAAIFLDGISNAGIRFAPGAVLLMENLHLICDLLIECFYPFRLFFPAVGVGNERQLVTH